MYLVAIKLLLKHIPVLPMLNMRNMRRRQPTRYTGIFMEVPFGTKRNHSSSVS